MDTRSARVSAVTRDEIAKQCRFAIRRPCKRVFIGRYIDSEEGLLNVYIAVERAGGPKPKS
jgi:hypothetical protein